MQINKELKLKKEKKYICDKLFVYLFLIYLNSFDILLKKYFL